MTTWHKPGVNRSQNQQTRNLKPEQPMKWFYVENGQQAGPVEESQLAELIASGKLRSDTLVWHEGMAAWQPFSAVCPPEFATAVGTSPIGTSSSTGETTEAVCAECGNIFRKEDMIPHGNVHICANCKPVFMQKMAEGVVLNTGQLRYAGFWIRFVAKFVDGLILGLPLILIFVFIGVRTAANPGSALPDTVGLIAQLGYYVLSMVYAIFFVGKYGATPGKMLCKIHIVMADGGKVSYGRAAGRFFAEILSGLICYIGYIMVAFDAEKRSLHDHICQTRVVMK
jgi:uncharacterized RDD family membrane protein YckC